MRHGGVGGPACINTTSCTSHHGALGVADKGLGGLWQLPARARACVRDCWMGCGAAHCQPPTPIFMQMPRATQTLSHIRMGMHTACARVHTPRLRRMPCNARATAAASRSISPSIHTCLHACAPRRRALQDAKGLTPEGAVQALQAVSRYSSRSKDGPSGVRHLGLWGAAWGLCVCGWGGARRWAARTHMHPHPHTHAHTRTHA